MRQRRQRTMPCAPRGITGTWGGGVCDGCVWAWVRWREGAQQLRNDCCVLRRGPVEAGHPCRDRLCPRLCRPPRHQVLVDAAAGPFWPAGSRGRKPAAPTSLPTPSSPIGRTTTPTGSCHRARSAVLLGSALTWGWGKRYGGRASTQTPLLRAPLSSGCLIENGNGLRRSHSRSWWLVAAAVGPGPQRAVRVAQAAASCHHHTNRQPRVPFPQPLQAPPSKRTVGRMLWGAQLPRSKGAGAASARSRSGPAGRGSTEMSTASALPGPPPPSVSVSKCSTMRCKRQGGAGSRSM